MGQPRFQRRKEQRPQEITAAAFDVFADKGYAGARVEEVAKRAGVSKGLLYRYFETKQDLFKAVIRSVVIQRIDTLLDAVEHTELDSADFMRGPLLQFLQQVPGSPVAIVVRLLIAEGHRHPDLVDFYWDNVVSRGLQTFSTFIERGVRRGEFKKTAVSDFPQLLLAPVMLSMIWRILFSDRELDTDKLIETQIDMLIAYIEA
jgi:AcrR family transcriptional regulator